MNKKIKLIMILMMVSVLIVGCSKGGINVTNNKYIDIEDYNDYEEFIDIESKSFNSKNKDIINNMNKFITSVDSKDYIDNQAKLDELFNMIKSRGFKYEEVLSPLSDIILNNKEDILEENYENISDRIGQNILLNLQEDGYKLLFIDNYIMAYYDISDILDNYKDNVSSNYLEVRKKLNEYDTLEVLNIPDNEDIYSATLNYDILSDAVIDLDYVLKDLNAKELKEEVEQRLMYYIGFLTGTMDANLIKDTESQYIDKKLVETFEKIESSVVSESLKNLSSNMLSLIEKNNEVSQLFLDQSLEYLFNFMDDLEEEVYEITEDDIDNLDDEDYIILDDKNDKNDKNSKKDNN